MLYVTTQVMHIRFFWRLLCSTQCCLAPPTLWLGSSQTTTLYCLSSVTHNTTSLPAMLQPPDKEVFLPLQAFFAEFAFCNTGIITLPVSLVCFLLWSRTMASADEEEKSLRRPFLLSAILFPGLTTSSGKLSTTSGGGVS